MAPIVRLRLTLVVMVCCRAGRDGLKSRCIMFYSRNDANRLGSLTDTAAAQNATQRQMAKENLDAMLRFATNTT
jgi:superfamily II DNA helicase RecQ